jgi:hypothetical protein
MPNIENVNASTLSGPQEDVQTGAQGFGEAAYHTERIFSQLGQEVEGAANAVGDKIIDRRTAQELQKQDMIFTAQQVHNKAVWNEALQQDAASNTNDPQLFDHVMGPLLVQQYQDGLKSLSTNEARTAYAKTYTSYASEFIKSGTDDVNALADVQTAQTFDKTNKLLIAKAAQDPSTVNDAIAGIDRQANLTIQSSHGGEKQIAQIRETAEKSKGNVWAAALRSTMDAAGPKAVHDNTDPGTGKIDEAGVYTDMKKAYAKFTGVDHPEAMGYLGGRETATGEDWGDTVVKSATSNAITMNRASQSTAKAQAKEYVDGTILSIRARYTGPDGIYRPTPDAIKETAALAADPRSAEDRAGIDGLMTLNEAKVVANANNRDVLGDVNTFDNLAAHVYAPNFEQQQARAHMSGLLNADQEATLDRMRSAYLKDPSWRSTYLARDNTLKMIKGAYFPAAGPGGSLVGTQAYQWGDIQSAVDSKIQEEADRGMSPQDIGRDLFTPGSKDFVGDPKGFLAPFVVGLHSPQGGTFPGIRGAPTTNRTRGNMGELPAGFGPH